MSPLSVSAHTAPDDFLATAEPLLAADPARTSVLATAPRRCSALRVLRPPLVGTKAQRGTPWAGRPPARADRRCRPASAAVHSGGGAGRQPRTAPEAVDRGRSTARRMPGSIPSSSAQRISARTSLGKQEPP